MRRVARRILTFALAGLGLIVAGVVSLVGAVTCRPTWYSPPIVGPARVEADKRDLTNLLDRIGGELNGRRPIEIEISEDQLNRWIVARRELPEGETINFHPFEEPVVDFRPSGMVIGARYRHSGMSAVASLRVKAEVDEGALRLRFESVGLGSLAVPRSIIDSAFREVIRGTQAEKRLCPDGSLACPNEFVWPNGKAPLRVGSVTYDDRCVRIRLDPR